MDTQTDPKNVMEVFYVTTPKKAFEQFVIYFNSDKNPTFPVIFHTKKGGIVFAYSPYRPISYMKNYQCKRYTKLSGEEATARLTVELMKGNNKFNEIFFIQKERDFASYGK